MTLPVFSDATVPQPPYPATAEPGTASPRSGPLPHGSGATTTAPLPTQPGCVHELFEAHVSATPDALAVVSHDGQLTYAELDRRANQLAHVLQQRGVGPESLVGVCQERSLDLVISVLGILKAGGAYVPLDPRDPAERLEYLLHDAQIGIVLTHPATESRVPRQHAEVLCLRPEWTELSHASTAKPECEARANNLIYVIYTSGSTGRPKGVLLEHRHVINYLDWACQYYRVAQGRGAPVNTSISFDATVTSLWCPLVSGRTVTLYPEHDQLTMLARDLLSHSAFSLVKITPAYLAALSDEIEHAVPVDQELAFVIGGEALTAAHLKTWRRVFPRARFINEYGPTETTVGCCVFEVRPDLSDEGPIPIGRPIASTHLYVLDEQQQPVPAGVAGELYIGGAGVGRGYLNRPDLTAQRFLSDPFSADPAARMYRTGDAVVLRDDGELEFLGRLDSQVKIRGYRIELGEIEQALLRDPAIKEAVVVLREDRPGQPTLVGYLVTRNAASAPTAPQLRQQLQAALPGYMVPDALVFLPILPLTRNGKVDRAALPAPKPDQVQRAETVLPRTPLEMALADMWCDLLGRTVVGVHDSFLELGGHSLLAMRLSSRLRMTLAVDIPVHRLLTIPTIAQLAAEVARQQAADPTATGSGPIPRAAVGQPVPLSFQQQGLWFVDQLEQRSAFYNIPAWYRLQGPLAVAALEDSLRTLIRRHAPLRTIFQETAGGQFQASTDERSFSLLRIDLRAAPGTQRESMVREQALVEVLRPFDLSQDLMLRGTLWQLADDEFGLLLVIHHIASDGWSKEVFERELGSLYQGHVTGSPVNLPALPVTYADYTLWQQQRWHDHQQVPLTAYWQQQLAGVPPVLDLPTDYRRPAQASYRGASHRTVIPACLTRQLHNLSRDEGATLFMTLLAAWKVLLARYARQTDLLVGTPIAGRTHADLEGLVGLFVNTLALRTDLSGHPTVRELLQRVKTVTLGAYAHQDMPFEKLVALLHPHRDTSRHPLVQVLFVLQSTAPPALHLPDIAVTRPHLPQQSAKVDLTLIATETPDGIELELEYATDLFESSSMSRLLGHYQTLLASFVADPQQVIDQLPLQTIAEQRQVIQDWNQTTAAFPREAALEDLFRARAQATPDAIALIAGAVSLTYAALDDRSDRLAAELQARGVGHATPVALCLDRSLELVVGILAILKAGGVYVPLDPLAPRDRLRFLLADSGARLLLTHSRDLADLGDVDIPTLCLDQPLTTTASVTPPAGSAGGERLAYIMYTSGSTGQPKGVLVPHRAIVRLVIGATYVPFSDRQRFLMLASPAFDAATLELWGPLLHGATCVIYAPRVPVFEDLAVVLHEQQITCLWLTSSLFNTIVDLQPDMLSDVPHLLIGGEALSVDHVRRFRSLYPQHDLINGYGPTECTTFACTYPIPGQLPADLNALPIGRPIANTQAFVLDDTQQPVPVGVPGELYLAGDGLALGYLNRPELTAEKFVTLDLPGQGRCRAYRTGDLVRWQADGQLEFLGRLDQQIKLRGFRIELGEIEATLRQQAQVQQAAVVLREESPAAKSLVAYIVPTAGARPTAAEIRAGLARTLPDYMLPASFVFLSELPLTANGKLNRQALPAPASSLPADSEQVLQTPHEEIIAAIWESVLACGPLSREANFFELGGHSLLATQVISRIRQAFSVTVPVRVLFEAPTIASLARAIERLLADADAPDASAALPALVPQSERPLSFAQERLWFLDQWESRLAAYNIPWVLRLTGPLDSDSLERSLHAVIQRHDTLRTRFTTVDGRPQLRIANDPDWQLTVTDLRHVPSPARDALWHEQLAAEVARPFDLEHDLPLRARIWQIADHDHVLAVTMHHIASDGWSMGVLTRELGAWYAALVAGAEPDLPDLPIQYTDYAAWQRAVLQGPLLERQLTYWKRQLAGAPALLELPTDFPRPARQTYRGAVRELIIESELTAALHRLSRQESASLFMVLLATWQLLLSRYSGQTDIVVGTATAGRNHHDLEGLVGFFVNTLVLRTDLSGQPTCRELLQRVRDVTLDAYAHQDLPFEKLVAEFQPTRDPSHSPLFQVMLTLQNTPTRPLDLAGVQAQPLPCHTQTAKFDLTLAFQEQAGQLRGALEYNTDLFTASTIERLVQYFQILLTAFVADVQQPITDLPWLTAAEQHQLLIEWNDTATVRPAELCLPALFERQVCDRPAELAVVAGAMRLTYRELNARANQLAHCLIEWGVGPEVCVALYIDRSADMLVALLGILKAGAAYIPLDPAYPAARIAAILEDSQPPVLVTQSSLLGTLPAHTARTLCLDQANRETFSDQNPAPRGSADNLAYVIYTSGSTGRPKGVLIEHRALSNFLWSMQRQPGLQSTETLLALTTLSFDIAALELFLPLTVGARVVIADRETATDGQLLQALIRNSGTTVLQATPATWQLLIDSGWTGDRRLKLLCGGEALTRKLADALLPRCGELWNLYGPTETTIWSTVARITPDASSLCIGRPIANTQVYVLDQLGHPVPVGVAGELYIGGTGVARGYLHQPELTAQKFVPNPFSSTADARCYRTGDLARWRADGTLECLGRTDHQVKLRGFRIELGEIEAVLETHPQISRAVVVLREDRPGDRRLVAFLLGPTTGTPAPADLRSFLQSRLPDYMLPAVFVPLPEFPLTPNGKVDRRALPDVSVPDQSDSQSDSQYLAPRDALEARLAQIWSQLLGLEHVSVTGNFFLLGGHSLLAAQLLARLRDQLGVTLTLRQLFETPTVAGLARLIREQVPLQALPPKADSTAPATTAGPAAPSEQSPYDIPPGSRIADEITSDLLTLPGSHTR
ncbi:MAG: amino acid adenylation domain-containing protein, partial [Planctomycetes bacterium]|nr:amino acid adenylation domain-containing protein [Planctomycetota bacterium]